MASTDAHIDIHLPPIPPPMPPSSALRKASVPDKGIWKTFFSLTGGSIFYCLSALSIIYGIAKLLGPLLAQPSVLGAAYPCLSALNVYEIALLGVLLFIVIRENVTDDAVSLVVLVALFLMGTGLALTTVANKGEHAALSIGILCLSLGAVKLYALKRWIKLHLPPALMAGLLLLVMWNFCAGPLSAIFDLTGTVTRQELFCSWLVIIASGALIILGTASAAKKEIAPSTPFLRGATMVVIFSLLLVIIAGIHQYVLSYLFDVDQFLGDYLPLVSIVCILLILLCLSICRNISAVEILVALAPMLFCLFAVFSKQVTTGPSMGRFILWYPPVCLGLTGGAFFWLGRSFKVSALSSASLLYILPILLTSGFNPAQPQELNWELTGILVILLCFAVGIFYRDPTLCLLSVLLVTIGISFQDTYSSFAAIYHCSEMTLGMGIWGAGAMVMAFFFKDRMPVVLTILASLGLMVAGLDCVPAAPSAADLLPMLALILLAFLVWLRMRFLPIVIILLVPALIQIWLLFTRITAWRYVLLSFALLFYGAWRSVRKGRKARQASVSNMPPADPGK